MNINRNNYEEYFILYLDHELAAEERREVEQFAEKNPDLREELEALLQYKLEPDARLVFSGKEDLMKEDGFPLITHTNYTDYLSLYIDGELSGHQQQKLEQFIQHHPGIQKELELLQQTKLQPETIVFAHKQVLYRHEKTAGAGNRRQVIMMQRFSFRRWRAVAALLVLALGLSLLFTRSNSGKQSTEVATTTTKTGETTSQLKSEQPLPIVPKNYEEQSNLATGPKTLSKNNGNRVVPASENDNNEVAAVRKDKPVIPVRNDAATAKELPAIQDPLLTSRQPKLTNLLPVPDQNPNVRLNSQNNADLDPVTTANKQKEETIVTPDNPQPSHIINASYNPDDANLNQPEKKKNKNRGIFRKIARNFEKRTNIDPTDDNKLLIAGLSIRLN